MARRKVKSAKSAARGAAKPKKASAKPKAAPNPPRTTKGWLTSPKFGSAGSGGAEFEPGPERD
jgi:hypothetical protein